MYGLATLGGRPPTWALAAFAGIRRRHDPARPRRHRGARRRRPRQRLGRSASAGRSSPLAACRSIAPIWRRAFLATGIALVATVAWGSLTGHGVVGSGVSPGVAPFNASWTRDRGDRHPGCRRVLRDRLRLDRCVAATRRWRRTSTSARACSSSSGRSSGARASATTTRSTCSSPGSPSSRRRPPRSPSGRSGNACARTGRVALADRRARPLRHPARARCGSQLSSSCRRSDRTSTRRSRRRSSRRSGTCRRTPSSPTPASRSRSSRSGTHGCSRSTPTPAGAIVPMCFEADFFGQLVGGQKSADNAEPALPVGAAAGALSRMRTRARRRRASPRSSRPTASTTSTRTRCIRTPSSRMAPPS